MTRLLFLDGDGIGPEITAATRAVVEAADAAFALGLRLETAAIGFAALATHGTTCPQAVLDRARACDGIVMGPVSHNDYPLAAEGGVNPSACLRIGLDLFANIRPAKTPPGIEALRPANLVIVRENTEGFYADRNMFSGSGEFMATPDVGLAIRKITRPACRRIAGAAFALALQRPARHVTAVHKANVLRTTDGLFLEEVRSVAAAYPSVRYDETLVDAMAAQLVRDPTRYDVIVTTNMFGDILSDLAAELTGGLGLGGSLNAGESHAMAQAQHGSAPDIAGRGIANPASLIGSVAMLDSRSRDRRYQGPTHAGPAPDIAGRGIANPASLIGSVAMLFDWLAPRRGAAFARAAKAIRLGVDAAVGNPEARTPDIGGRGTTNSTTEAVTALIRENSRHV